MNGVARVQPKIFRDAHTNCSRLYRLQPYTHMTQPMPSPRPCRGRVADPPETLSSSPLCEGAKLGFKSWTNEPNLYVVEHDAETGTRRWGCRPLVWWGGP